MNSRQITIYIMRHGQAKGNKEDVLLGRMEAPLTEQGRENAAKIAKEFKILQIDYFYSSPLKRAVETAEILAKYHNKEIIIDELLLERELGSFQGITITEAFKKVQDVLPYFNNFSDEEKMSYKFSPEMESAGEVVDRFKKFLSELVDNLPGKTILAVTHGGLMLYFLVSLGLNHYTNLFGDPNALENLGYFKLTTDGNSYKILETKGYHPNL